MERLAAYPPGRVHSIVLWTKNPENILKGGPLKDTLASYRQLYLHFTITGMGGGEFEPLIPPWQESVKMVRPLIQLAGGPGRISWRFDPILEAENKEKSFSNLHLFPELAEKIAPLGIKTCRVSWVTPYKKVIARLARKGWALVPWNCEKRSKQAGFLSQEAKRHGLNLHFCSMEGFPVSRCIDGSLLSGLHPDRLACSTDKARGQRALCGCTDSLDIGWYSLKCRHGCVYCYAS